MNRSGRPVSPRPDSTKVLAFGAGMRDTVRTGAWRNCQSGTLPLRGVTACRVRIKPAVVRTRKAAMRPAGARRSSHKVPASASNTAVASMIRAAWPGSDWSAKMPERPTAPKAMKSRRADGTSPACDSSSGTAQMTARSK